MFLPNGDSAFFLDLYGRYRRDPLSVPSDWRLHFEALETEAPDGPATEIVDRLIDAYCRFGHREAGLDPLALTPRPPVAALSRIRDAARLFAAHEVSATIGGQARKLTLGALDATLRSLYAGPVGIEATHLADEAEQEWLHAEYESNAATPLDAASLTRALESVGLADVFESFLAVKFPAKKRFGIEGAETAIVLLREMLQEAASEGVDEVVMGGMHRGRLATLATVLGKPLATLLAEIKGKEAASTNAAHTGDVPYHLGHQVRLSIEGRPLTVGLLPHPSHLTTVVPVALGLTYGTQQAAGGGAEARRCIMSVVLHTDAAFSGQGLVSEVMQLGNLAGYSVGGTVHLVINNQIGFTTLPSEARSSEYCTDIGRAVGIPVLHVNGDDPVAVARVARLAVRWRQRFGKDVLIDLVCYRRNGHNELDEPRFTQPGIWAAIDRRPTVRQSFGDGLVSNYPHVVTAAEQTERSFRSALYEAYEVAANTTELAAPRNYDQWSAIQPATEDEILAPVETGLPLETLRTLGRRLCTLPAAFQINPKVARFYQTRHETIDGGHGLTLATGEALAFASLLDRGIPVRLAGQDSVRGAFTQRHLAVYDRTSGRSMFPLAPEGTPTRFEAVNSPLSEYATLGFEYGNSLASPHRMVVWEAQFGDFLNGAQIIVDQFIVSAEAKWGMQSALVLLLPHGLEGQGPDHSSARIERLLQLCADGNMILANPSTPANLFHLLRRQLVAPWRKPLFVIAPKSLLRARACTSSLADFGPGTFFRNVIDDGSASRSVRRLILCSGKVFYALDRARLACGLGKQVALIRIEQLFPFPAAELQDLLQRYRSADLVWCQEEPENQGAWHHVQRRLATVPRPLAFAGRRAMPVSAGGSVARHEREEAALLAQALDVPASTLAQEEDAVV